MHFQRSRPLDAQKTVQWLTRCRERRLWLLQMARATFQAPGPLALPSSSHADKNPLQQSSAPQNHPTHHPLFAPAENEYSHALVVHLVRVQPSQACEFLTAWGRDIQKFAGRWRPCKHDTRFVLCLALPPLTAAASAQPHRPPRLCALLVLSIGEGGASP